MIPLPDTNTMLLGHGQDDVQRRFDVLRRLRPDDSGQKAEKSTPESGTSDVGQESRLREASQDFEALFLHQLIKQMRATVPHHDPLRGKGEEFWQSHFDMEMASVLAQSGGMGLGDMIFEQLRQSQVQATRHSEPGSKPMPLTILAPTPAPSPTAADALKNESQTSPTALHLAASQGPYSASGTLGHLLTGSADAVSIPGTTSTMNLVRSLARSIEERGGVVSEHPGSVNGPSATESTNISPPILPPMHWPLEGRISSGFGWRPDPFTGEQTWHAGVDMVAPEGTPIGAAWDGRVVFVGQRGGYGNMVVLEHAGGWRSYYAHNNKNTVKVGDKVEAGQKIATVGSTGRSTGPHLHFEIRQGTTAWNPKQIRDRLEAGLSIGKQVSA
ncbi:peptidoglycan DD-metalloendopeptidase family protein [Desulfonatronum thioautotrophicum]|uniref:peptidoglycan DD-metalloendopeptidase family protein n=1 Tax=Desulfonatronum thioautotrophicum TaxID=617001 RepID=UPI0006993A33|nr:peptidoglycan DD-metalloendopeptidase family protein [Desulfonatronum thioautotrophicum]